MQAKQAGHDRLSMKPLCADPRHSQERLKTCCCDHQEIAPRERAAARRPNGRTPAASPAPARLPHAVYTAMLPPECSRASSSRQDEPREQLLLTSGAGKQPAVVNHGRFYKRKLLSVRSQLVALQWPPPPRPCLPTTTSQPTG